MVTELVAHVDIMRMLANAQQGGVDNVLDDCKTGSTKLVNVVDMLHMFPFAQQGCGGADNVLDDCKTWSTEFVAVVDMLHMFPFAQQGGGGADNVLDDCKTGSTKLVALVGMLHMLACAQQGGLITFLTTVRQGPRNFLPLLTCCTCSLMLNRGG